MKRAIIWMLLLTAAMNVAMAQKKNPYRSERQEKVWTDRKAWFNFAYGKQSLKIDKGDICVHSDWGAGISTGRTYYLHRRPILGLMKFGLDWSYFDLNAACYSAPSMGMEGGYYYPDWKSPLIVNRRRKTGRLIYIKVRWACSLVPP